MIRQYEPTLHTNFAYVRPGCQVSCTTPLTCMLTYTQLSTCIHTYIQTCMNHVGLLNSTANAYVQVFRKCVEVCASVPRSLLLAIHVCTLMFAFILVFGWRFDNGMLPGNTTSSSQKARGG